MAEPQTLHWSHSPSNIPIAAPRPTRRLSFTQLNLASSRIPSLGALAVQASPVPKSPANVSSPQPPGGSFRSLRNLLPFGPGKQSTSASNVSNGPKNSFSNFGSIRRSMTGERKNSISTVRTEEPENLPVVAIDSSFEVEGTGRGKAVVGEDDSGQPTDDPLRFQHSFANRGLPPLPLLEPGPTLAADLSTIIEADTSGISKQDPTEEGQQSIGILLPDDRSSRQNPNGAMNALSIPELSISRPRLNGVDNRANLHKSSVPDVSASNVASEVLDVSMVKDCATADEWLSGARGAEPAPPAKHAAKSLLDANMGTDFGDANLSFNLSALDPDLAALLSPNRIAADAPTIQAINAIAPPLSTPRSPIDLTLEDERASGPHKGSIHADGESSPPPSPMLGSQSTPAPARRSISSSRPATGPRPSTSSSLPRLTRGYLTPSSSNKELARSSSSVTSADQTIFENGRRASSDQVHQRPAPPSPLSSHSQSRYGQPSLRQPSQSRLATSVRQVTPYTAPSNTKRPSQNRMLTVQPVNGDAESVSPSARTSSSFGTTATSRLQPPPRSSFDSESPVDLTDRDRTHALRSRKRSMSMEGSQPSPGSVLSYQTPPITRPSTSMSNRPTAEWLGPRTAKAFAAAGLLDFEKDSGGRINPNNPSSRFGAIRSNNSDRDVGRYTPSRMGFSEVSETNSSLGRNRSASRTMTMSEAVGPLMESPTLTSTTHRTTFSGGSTAPTSVSVPSPQHNMQATLQLMKEKHDIETEALLSALSDSQRTTKILREENGELREKVVSLEHRLKEAIQQKSRQASMPSTFLYSRPGNPLERLPRTVSADHHPKPSSHSRIPSSRYPVRAPSPQKIVPPERRHNSSPLKLQRRLSTTSSNFPIPPSNMSLLMQEEDGMGSTYSYRSSSPPPPPLPPPSTRATTTKNNGSLRHNTHSRSVSSDKNISPTTATFSMTTGSPGSLFLRPEHELHLGDMTNLDLAGLVPTDDDDHVVDIDESC